jgi:glycosyltransferase involved in cell wall biosynthesis
MPRPRLAFVVQRYGADITGGAEYHCRLVAEDLARRAEVTVLTTCAGDYVTWANRHPPGERLENGVRVLRFPVSRPRDLERFARLTARLFGERARTEPGQVEIERAREADPELARQWVDEQGPFAPELVRHVQDHASDHDAFIFFSYRYYPTCRALPAVADRALLVPTAEDDGAYHLPIYRRLLERPRAIVFNSVEERAMLARAVGGGLAAGDVVGVGTELPAAVDPDGFRARHGLVGPFLLYVGRVDLNKGCPELFDFFLRYRAEKASPLRLVLLGQAILPVPSDPAIVSLGFQPDAEKWNALAASAVFVMPSPLESLSMATLEAWWSRKPALVNAKCAVLRGQCRRANAGLYYGSYDEFAEALALLERDSALRDRLGRSGRAYFDAHYTREVIASKYDALLAPVLAGPARRSA